MRNKIIALIFAISALCCLVKAGFSQDTVTYNYGAQWINGKKVNAQPDKITFKFDNKRKRADIYTSDGSSFFVIDSLFAKGESEDGNYLLVGFYGRFFISGATINGVFVTAWSKTSPQKRLQIYLFIGKDAFVFYNQ
jgi:hypothetical protein